MAQTDKHETFLHQLKVLMEMTGEQLDLNYTPGEGYRLIGGGNQSGHPLSTGLHTKEELQKMVLFAIAALRLKQINDRPKAICDDCGEACRKVGTLTPCAAEAPGAVKWISETECDFCHEDAREKGETFVDGKTKLGPWALMCEKCHRNEGYPKMGTGYGQRYSSKTLFKVEG